MSDTIEGSSNAAQSAQLEGIEKPAGFFKRLFAGKTETNEPAPSYSDTLSPVSGLKILSDLRVEDVAVPRADIIAVSNDLKLDELLKVFTDSGYSRLPVYNEALDTPDGLLHLKDLALKHGFNGKVTRFSIKRLVRPLLYVPPSMTIGVLLQKMQADRIHMALVIDEYGGVDGLVTIEDLVEQVVGEIADEHDVEEDDYWIEEKPGVYMCQARAPLDEFEKVLEVDLASSADDEDIETLGGLVFMMIGRVPVRGEVIKHPDGFEFEVVDADPRRIKKLRVSRSQKR
ncbi:HlyC/CorC family transporter [Amylibacter sp. SFDW26]|uniref:hemolysin family protein n=1 Tax=Amylibacter sp. SFDW26 TaxID=2652722 RepID=UPI001261E243|nr:hemolysin family protein [Amylibacter sp. SFDW26]KAB7613354.1 HlyC/CorC family transporter [Amylibacter sp. SFDW26]